MIPYVVSMAVVGRASRRAFRVARPRGSSETVGSRPRISPKFVLCVLYVGGSFCLFIYFILFFSSWGGGVMALVCGKIVGSCFRFAWCLTPVRGVSRLTFVI